MNKYLYLLLVFVVLSFAVNPAYAASGIETGEDIKRIDTDDYIMFAVGGIGGAGLQSLYFRDKPRVESRIPGIVMSYFIWNAIVLTKETHIDDTEDMMLWEDLLIANAGLTLGVALWHYTVGKSIHVKSKRRNKKYRNQYGNYLKIDNNLTQIQLY